MLWDVYSSMKDLANLVLIWEWLLREPRESFQVFTFLKQAFHLQAKKKEGEETKNII